MLFVFVLIMVISVFCINMGTDNSYYRRTLNEGWTVKQNNGVTYSDFNLDTDHIEVTNAGDQIVLLNTLPEDLEDNRTMLISMVHSVTDVYIDDVKVYTHGREEFSEGKMIGFGIDFISVPAGSAGKPVKIYLYVTEDNAFSTFASPVFYNEATVYKDYLSEKRIPLVVSVSLIVIGACITLSTFVSFFRTYSMDKLFCIGVFSLCIGCWSLSNYNLAFLLTNNMAAKSTLEYLSLYMALLPVLFYFRTEVTERGKKREIFTFYVLVLIEVQIIVIASLLHFLNVVHLPAYIKVYQVFMVVAGLFVAYLLIEDMMDKKSHKILVWGFAGILVIAVRDVLVFNLIKYTSGSGVESQYKSYIAAAALIFVMSLFIDFLVEMRKQLYSSAQNDFYVKIAYYDVLTNLFTRRKAEEIFEELDNNASFDYTLVQYDLNNLKVTNDVYGHEEGDKLILRFADVLRETFNEGEILVRMGGDEFIAIINGSDESVTKAKLERMNELIAKANAEDTESLVKLSVSYGYASSKDMDQPVASKIYKLADKRMYEQKEEYYRTHGMRRRQSDIIV